MEFREFQAKFMMYQSWFYYRSGSADPTNLIIMQTLADVKKIDEMYDEIYSNQGLQETQKLVFEYHSFDNYEQRREKLNRFLKTAKEKIKIQPIKIKGLQISFPFDYVRDGKGAIAPETLFARWDQILRIHKMRRRFTPTQICIELNLFNDNEPNSYKPVSRALKKADELIQSTLTATFPYPESKVDLINEVN